MSVRLLRLTLCLSVAIASPGLLPYAALAGGLSSARGGRSVRPGQGLRHGPLGSPRALTPSPPRASALAQPAPNAGLDVVIGAQTIVAQSPLAAPYFDRRRHARARNAGLGQAAASAAGLSAGVSKILQAAGDISAASPGTARRTGLELQNLLSSASDKNHTGQESYPADQGFSSLPNPFSSRPTGFSQAKPAGDSIREAQQDYHPGWSSMPPQPPAGPPPGDEESPGEPARQSPLWAKLIFAGCALLPAALLGLPLWSVSAATGGLVMASSIGLAILPFLVPAAPRLARAVPGAVLSALGLAVLGTTAAITGALVFAGGWGLVFFSVDDKRRAYADPEAAMTATLGAAGGIVAAGLLLLAPAGWIWAALRIAAWAGPLLLLRHLPGWVGEGIDSVFEGVKLSISDVHHVLSSTRRDTLLFQRLLRFTEGALKRSSWHALWLGPLVWLPIGLLEAAQAALALGLGLALGALRALPLFLWGAAHEIKKDSAATRILAAWSRSQFILNKAETFNPFAKLFIPWANAESLVKRLPATLGLRFTQLAWLLVLAATTPLLALWGPFAGFLTAGKSYDPARDDPAAFEPPEDALPDEVPELPERKVETSAWPLRIAASGIGLLPAYFLAVPLLISVSPWLSFLYLAALAGVATLPVTPSSAWYPRWLRRIPGVLLGWAGAVALLSGASLGLGIAATLGGIALYHLVGKLSAPKPSGRIADAPAALGGFIGALALLAGLGLALLDLPRWPERLFSSEALTWPNALTAAAYLLSPFLLYHLPRSLRTGLRTALESLWTSMKEAYRGLVFWQETRFERNLSDFFDYHSPWLAPLWALTQIMKLLELLLAGALGLILFAAPGRAVSVLLGGAARAEDPEGFPARFLGGFNASWFEAVEGSRAWLLMPAVQWLIPTMSRSSGQSRRPTVKALLAFALARALQSLWLAALLLLATALTPAVLLVNLRAGWKTATRPAGPSSD